MPNHNPGSPQRIMTTHPQEQALQDAEAALAAASLRLEATSAWKEFTDALDAHTSTPEYAAFEQLRAASAPSDQVSALDKERIKSELETAFKALESTTQSAKYRAADAIMLDSKEYKDVRAAEKDRDAAKAAYDAWRDARIASGQFQEEQDAADAKLAAAVAQLDLPPAEPTPTREELKRRRKEKKRRVVAYGSGKVVEYSR